MFKKKGSHHINRLLLQNQEIHLTRATEAICYKDNKQLQMSVPNDTAYQNSYELHEASARKTREKANIMIFHLLHLGYIILAI